MISRQFLSSICVLLTSVLQVQIADRVKAVDLVQDGKPIAVIVATVASDATEPPVKGKPPKRKAEVESDEAFAVRVLREWIAKITDVELPVVNKGPNDTFAIYVGKAAIAAGLKLDDIVSPSHEGIRIVVDRQRVLIAGQSEAATLKAVCRFLEELGCRYLMDGPLGEVYPRSTTLSIDAIDITEKPGLQWRNPKGPTWNARLWKAWNGAGGDPFGHSHAWSSYVPPSAFEEHPEFFALGSDGQRKNNGWICTSNAAMREYFASNVIKAIEKGTLNPSLSPTDGRGYCQCVECKKQDDLASIEPSSGTTSVSNRYLDFFDWIGRRVGQVHPESVLSFYCYADYTQPPTDARKLGSNMCAMIAPIRYCRLHPIGHPGCTSREQQVAMTEGWAAVATRLGYYNYMYNLADGTLPMFKFSSCEKEFPYFADKGLTYMTIEVLSNWHIYGPQIYLSLRLAYDPKANAEAIMEDYWLKFYGKNAAPHMKAYWMGIDAAQQRLKSHAGSFFGLAQIYTPDFLKECQSQLDKAAAAAKGDAVYEQRVELHAEGLQSARAYRAIADAMNRGDFAEAKHEYEATLERLRQVVEKGYANREYGIAYLKRYLGETVLQGDALIAEPNRLLHVMPDRWRFCFDESDIGNDQGFERADFNDSDWPIVATFNTTLDAQGYDKNTVLWYRNKMNVPEKYQKLALFFGEVDGKAEVYVNGNKIVVPEQYQNQKKPTSPGAKPPREGMTKPRIPFELDVTAVVHPGENVIAIRVDHTSITELSLGGLVRPVLFVEKPE